MKDHLEQSCKELEVAPASHDKIRNYLKLLEKWRRQINLVGRCNEDELIELHVLDSLAVTRHLPKKTRTLIDVGSGAGRFRGGCPHSRRLRYSSE